MDQGDASSAKRRRSEKGRGGEEEEQEQEREPAPGSDLSTLSALSSKVSCLECRASKVSERKRERACLCTRRNDSTVMLTTLSALFVSFDRLNAQEVTCVSGVNV
jgi:hypothetical protein